MENKISVLTRLRAHARDFQRFLFEHGFTWMDGSQKVEQPNRHKKVYSVNKDEKDFTEYTFLCGGADYTFPEDKSEILNWINTMKELIFITPADEYLNRAVVQLLDDTSKFAHDTSKEKFLNGEGVFRVFKDKEGYFVNWFEHVSEGVGVYNPTTHWDDIRDFFLPEPITVTVDGEEHEVEFSDTGSIKIGCTPIDSEKVDAIIERRKEVMS